MKVYKLALWLLVILVILVSGVMISNYLRLKKENAEKERIYLKLQREYHQLLEEKKLLEGKYEEIRRYHVP